MATIDQLVEATQEHNVQYKKITYNDVPLLIPLGKLKLIVQLTWERTQDPALIAIEEELKIRIRDINKRS